MTRTKYFLFPVLLLLKTKQKATKDKNKTKKNWGAQQMHQVKYNSLYREFDWP